MYRLLAVFVLCLAASSANAQCPGGWCRSPLRSYKHPVAAAVVKAPVAAVRVTAHAVKATARVATAPVRFVARHKPVRRLAAAPFRLLARATFRPQRRCGRFGCR
jgi:hypothetical protein